MKRIAIRGLLAALGMAATVASAQVPLLHYTFNETGTAAQSTGSITTPLTLINTSGTAQDLHSAGGLGVSGLPGDRAFDNTASTGMGKAGVGGVALLPPETLPTLSSFTYQIWINVGTEVGKFARLLDDAVISLECGTDGNLDLYVNSGEVSSASAYSQTGQWLFIAVTYDGTKTLNNVVFYAGTKSQAVVQIGSVETLSQGPVSQAGNALGIGNDRSYTNSRPLDGYMDDVRLYGSATDSSGVLTQAQLETLREQDVQYASLSVPVISSSLSATGTSDLAFEYQIQARNNPASFSMTGLPTALGLAVNASTGLISGTPTESGTFSATINAINVGGTGSATLALVVAPPPKPVITSVLSVTGTEQDAFSYQIEAKYNPASFSVTGLPTGLGLTLDESAGLISGTLRESGTFFPTISAINEGGTGSATLSLVVELPPKPFITSGLSATGRLGESFEYQIEADNRPTSFAAKGLPPGVTCDTSTGLISGMPTMSGAYPVTISAINLGGTDSDTLALTILPPPPVITSRLTASGSNVAAFSYQITATNAPVSFNATGLPAGLSVNPSSGLISGEPAVGGVFPVTISATNAGGTGTARLVITTTINFKALRGAYDGLGAVNGTNVGLFAVTLGPKGRFTGKLELAGVSHPVSGRFSTYGKYRGAIVSGAARLALNLSVDAAPPGVSGAIAVTNAAGTTSYSVESSLLGGFTAGTLPAGLAGRYTAIFPPVSGVSPALPHAPGYGRMFVTTTGAVTFVGTLGDGAPFTAGGQLHADGRTWTLFAPLYTGGSRPGAIAGTMTFETSAESDCDGTLDWIKPKQTAGVYYRNGFAASVDLMAAKYAAPPLKAGAATFTLGGGNLADSAITDQLTISSKDTVTVSGINDGNVTVTLAPATGAFSGMFRYPGTKAETPFGGVIYKKPAPAGFGLFRGTDQSGEVDIAQ